MWKRLCLHLLHATSTNSSTDEAFSLQCQRIRVKRQGVESCHISHYISYMFCGTMKPSCSRHTSWFTIEPISFLCHTHKYVVESPYHLCLSSILIFDKVHPIRPLSTPIEPIPWHLMPIYDRVYPICLPSTLIHVRAHPSCPLFMPIEQ